MSLSTHRKAVPKGGSTVKKKFIALMLALLVLCAFASCGGGEVEEEEGPKKPISDGEKVEFPPIPIEPIN